MRLGQIPFILVAILALSRHSVAGDETAPSERGAAPPAVLYCYDRDRDVVSRVLAAECRGTIISEADAGIVAERRNRQIMRAMAEQPGSRRDGQRIASLGTAFYVDETGRLLTNHHVVEGCKAVTVRASSGDERAARVLAIDATEDLALLQADGKPGAVAVFRLEGGAARDSFVATVGYPNQGLPPLEPLVTSGVLLGVGSQGAAAGRLVITADIRHGNSGGPIFDDRGQVIGLLSAKIDAVRVYSQTRRDVGDTGFGVPLATLVDFLRRNGARFHQANGGERLDLEQILALSRRFVVRADCWK